MNKVADYTPPRSTLHATGIALGVLAGFVNSILDIDMRLTPSLFGWLAVSIIVVVTLHEGAHGAVAVLLGHRPLFGLKPPLVYVTFDGKVPRGHFMLVAIAPLVLLDLFFGFFYMRDTFKLFCDLSLIVNSIGSVADIWVLLKLTGAPNGAFIQDTKTGFEVWAAHGTTHVDAANPKEV